MTETKRECGGVSAIVRYPIVRFIEPDTIRVKLEAYESEVDLQAPYNMNPEYIRRLAEHGSVVVMVAIESDTEKKLPPMKVWLSSDEAVEEQLRRMRERERLRAQGKECAVDYHERQRAELMVQMGANTERR